MLSVRGSKGIYFQRGPPESKREESFRGDDGDNCKAMAFSPNGKAFAWANGKCVQIAHIKEGRSWTDILELDHPRASALTFSPFGTVLATWETYAVRNGQATDNVRLWNAASGESLGSYVQKKMSDWAPQWSSDEKFASRAVNNQIYFYENNEFNGAPALKLILRTFESFSFAPGSNAKTGYHVVVFLRGQKGAPSFGKFYTYPRFKEGEMVANKSLYFAEKMQAEWSKDGTCVLLVTQAEVDKSDASYYGKQQLHFMNSSGDTFNVSLPKQGPIYHVAWSPTAAEWASVYGYMPAKVTLFNRKCEKIFDFGTGPRNVVHFNPQGTLLLIGGFGNLKGVIQIWDINAKKIISNFEAPDTTDLQWCPDGQRFMTSTCAPRLRQDNGFKIWHYSSSLLFEQMFKHELWEVRWQNSETPFEPFEISNVIVKGIESTIPLASKEAYRPPGARKTASTGFKLHEDEPPENMKKADPANISKSSAKNKKRRENAAKRKKELEVAAAQNEASSNQSKSPTSSIAVVDNGTGDPEKDKKVRKLNEKLRQIEELKLKQKEGKVLEKNQLDKIKKEQEILDQLAQLRL